MLTDKILELISNTGIGLALVSRLMGYCVRVIIPEGTTEEREKLIKAPRAELLHTPDNEGLPGAVRRVEQMAAEDELILLTYKPNLLVGGIE